MSANVSLSVGYVNDQLTVNTLAKTTLCFDKIIKF